MNIITIKLWKYKLCVSLNKEHQVDTLSMYYKGLLKPISVSGMFPETNVEDMFFKPKKKRDKTK